MGVPDSPNIQNETPDIVRSRSSHVSDSIEMKLIYCKNNNNDNVSIFIFKTMKDSVGDHHIDLQRIGSPTVSQFNIICFNNIINACGCKYLL
jgi:hypothetical protein